MAETITNLIINALITISAITIYFYIKESVETSRAMKDRGPADRHAYSKGNQPLNSIFYGFSHKSYKEWLDWILSQDADVQEIAYERLVEHLEGDAKHWGSITLEVLSSLVGFDKKDTFDILTNFLRNSRKLWSEYKTVPHYYEKTSLLLLEMHKENTLKILQSELGVVGNEKASFERKRIIINVLATLEEDSAVADILMGIIIDKDETFDTRSHALRATKRLSTEDKIRIYGDILDNYARYTKRELSRNNVNLFEDVTEKACQFLDNRRVATLLGKSCANEFLKEGVVSVVKDLINNHNVILDVSKLLTLYDLPDNENNDIKRALATRNTLTSQELELVIEPIPLSIEMGDLYEPHNIQILPIPTIFSDEYNEYVDLLLNDKLARMSAGVSKLCGGVMITGDAEFTKIYFAKAYAQKRKWEFMYIDAAELRSKADCDAVQQDVSKIKQHCVVVIKNINVLRQMGDSETVSLHKLLHAFDMQSGTKRFFIVGTIPEKLGELDEATNKFIKELRVKSFPNWLEINGIDDKGKNEILQMLETKILPERFTREDVSNLSEVFTSIDGCSSAMELYFKIIKYLQVMLLIFGEITPIAECKRLQAQRFADE